MRKITKFTLSLLAMLMVTLTASAWEFKSVSPARGNVDEISTITLAYPENIEWTGYTSKPYYMWVEVDGQEVAVSNFDQDFLAQNFIMSFSTPITSGTVVLKFGMGANNLWAAPGMCEQTFTWTVGAAGPTEESNYTCTYENGELKLTWDGKAVVMTKEGTPTITGYTGTLSTSLTASIFLGPNDAAIIKPNTTLAPGTYTLNVPAGYFKIDGNPNAAIEHQFTVQGGSYSGTPAHETIFLSGETVPAIPFTVDNDKVKIVTEGKPYLDTTIDVDYNMNDTKELNWKNGTKFIITAKDEITKIIFVPTADSENAISSASASVGTISNGVWTGTLAKDATLTLTANDGINLSAIYICYNGDDFSPTSQEDVKGEITIQYPVEGQKIAKQVDGGKFCTFTTNKEYAQVIIKIVNESNPTSDNLDAFPPRMVDNKGEKSDNLHVGENTVTAATPASGASGKGDDFYFYKGDSYKMIVMGYVNMWDQEDDYDAIAEVHFIGDGKEHAAESNVKLVKVTPEGSAFEPGEIAMQNGVITLEFDGAVTSVTAVTPQGMDGDLKHTATAKAGSDNKIWEINLGDQSGFGSAESETSFIEVDVTAKAADGIVIMSDTRADRGLELMYKLVDTQSDPSKVVTLGSPVWSVAEGAEIEASTSSINIKFPNAENVEGSYTLEVAGSIGDKNLNLVNVSGSGTMANGANITVSLSENVGYNLTIGTITVKDGNGTTVYTTDMGNYQLNFGTKAAQGGGGETDYGILGAASISADANGVTVSWPDADFSGLTGGAITFDAWSISAAGVTCDFYPDMITDLSNGAEVAIPYERIAVWDGNNYVPVELNPGDNIEINIPANGITVWDEYYNWSPDVYKNAQPITLNVTVPGTQNEPSEVMIFEKGVTPNVSNADFTLEKDGVKLEVETASTSSTVLQYFRPSITANGLTAWTYQVFHFSSEKTIKSIEFEGSALTLKASAARAAVNGGFKNNTWTGSANEVDLQFSGSQSFTLTSIKVTLENVATGISEVKTISVPNVMFNLNGMQVKNAKGIVILNGKKYMLK